MLVLKNSVHFALALLLVEHAIDRANSKTKNKQYIYKIISIGNPQYLYYFAKKISNVLNK